MYMYTQHFTLYTFAVVNCCLFSRVPGTNEEVYSPRRQQYKQYNDNEHAKTDMYIEHCIKY